MLLALLVLCAAPDAGRSVVLKLDGPGGAQELTLSELQALGSVTADWSDKAGAHKVTGVPLNKLLPRMGMKAGPDATPPKDKHKELRSAVVATATDGFQAVFSSGELDESIGSTNALVVWEIDGKPLGAMGPVRIVVTTDKRGTRSLYQLLSLKLVDLSK